MASSFENIPTQADYEAGTKQAEARPDREQQIADANRAAAVAETVLPTLSENEVTDQEQILAYKKAVDLIVAEKVRDFSLKIINIENGQFIPGTIASAREEILNDEKIKYVSEAKPMAEYEKEFLEKYARAALMVGVSEWYQEHKDELSRGRRSA